MEVTLPPPWSMDIMDVQGRKRIDANAHRRPEKQMREMVSEESEMFTIHEV